MNDASQVGSTTAPGEGLVHLSVSIERAGHLIDDLDRALARA